ncbi:hypothetical protein LCGC14_1403250 [marine sediment metagenome]|uniref:Uncharacterized protein n=1 Tax=marine sediment metagenome TaxID=412755 RepID=A0A0F9MBV1_9ZZZZ
MTLRRFDDKLTFICNSCRQVVDSKVRVETLIGIICNDCYERKLMGLPIKTAGRENHPRTRGRAKKKSNPLVVGGTETGHFSSTDPMFTRTPRPIHVCKRLHLTPSDCEKDAECGSD